MEEIFNEKRWKENPNLKAKIAFVIFYPFQYYVYKNIYKYLDDAEFIVDLGAFFPIRQPDELAGSIISLLEQKKVHYRILYYSDYFLDGYLKEYFLRYTTLVGVWERGCHFLACNRDKKQVNLTYGAGKELTQVRFSRRYHDLILAFGSRDVKLFSLFTAAKIVGNPKFDDWFNDELDRDFIRQMEARISKDKKTVLYLPTHSDLSSLDYLIDELKSLSDVYNIIVKMHYFTVREEPEKIDALSNGKIVILEDDVDLLPLLKIADVVLSDNSSAIFDAILADKPLVVTDFLSDDYLDVKHKETKRYRRGNIGAVTYSGSIEQIIKKNGSVITMQSPEEARMAIDKALQDPVFYRQARKKIREEVFSFNDGKCGLRAAEEIKKIGLEKNMPGRPILFHAIEDFVSRIGRKSFLFRKERSRVFEQCNDVLLDWWRAEKQQKGEIFFSVIVSDDGEGDLEATLRSLCNQEFPIDDYEVLVVSVRDGATIVRKLKKMESANGNIEKMSFFMVQEHVFMGDSILEAIRVSRGRIVCFTRSGYLLPSRWLAQFLLTYKRFPSTAGVGGYVSELPKNKSSFGIFSDLEIGKKLGIWKSHHFFSKLYEVKNNVFYQNPAGSFCNISYRKDVLKDLLYVFEKKSIESIELELKILVMTQHDICFIPYVVHRIESLTLKKFIKESFFQGVALRAAYSLYPSEVRYSRIGFLTCFKMLFLYLIDGRNHKKLTRSRVIFTGYFFRWLGGVYWKFRRMAQIEKALSYYTEKKENGVSFPSDKDSVS